jgi:hypothetical protein
LRRCGRGETMETKVTYVCQKCGVEFSNVKEYYKHEESCGVLNNHHEAKVYPKRKILESDWETDWYGY